MVVNGQKAMPSFHSQLDDVQIAAVVHYVRTSLGNDYRDGPATPELVHAACP